MYGSKKLVQLKPFLIPAGGAGYHFTGKELSLVLIQWNLARKEGRTRSLMSLIGWTSGIAETGCRLVATVMLSCFS